MGSSACHQQQLGIRSRTKGTPVRAPAPPVERLVVGVALLDAAEQPVVAAAPGSAASPPRLSTCGATGTCTARTACTGLDSPGRIDSLMV